MKLRGVLAPFLRTSGLESFEPGGPAQPALRAGYLHVQTAERAAEARPIPGNTAYVVHAPMTALIIAGKSGAPVSGPRTPTRVFRIDERGTGKGPDFSAIARDGSWAPCSSRIMTLIARADPMFGPRALGKGSP